MRTFPFDQNKPYDGILYYFKDLLTFEKGPSSNIIYRRSPPELLICRNTTEIDFYTYPSSADSYFIINFKEISVKINKYAFLGRHPVVR